MATRFRNIARYVKGVQWTGDNFAEISDLCAGAVRYDDGLWMQDQLGLMWHFVPLWAYVFYYEASGYYSFLTKGDFEATYEAI